MIEIRALILFWLRSRVGVSAARAVRPGRERCEDEISRSG